MDGKAFVMDFAPVQVDADRDNDSLCGHTFAFFDAAKITRYCAKSWHCDIFGVTFRKFI